MKYHLILIEMMTTIHKIGSKYRVITKGAPDVLLEKCQKQIEGGLGKVSNLEKVVIQKENEKMAKKALRVIAVAYKDLDFLPQKIDTNTIENNLIFVRISWYDRSTKRRSKRGSKNM